MGASIVRAVQSQGGGWLVQRGYTYVGNPWTNEAWMTPVAGLNGWMAREEAVAKCMELVLTEDYQLWEEVWYDRMGST